MADPITKIEPIVLRIPFDDGGKGQGITPTRWTNLDSVHGRVETREGLDAGDGREAPAVADAAQLVQPVGDVDHSHPAIP